MNRLTFDDIKNKPKIILLSWLVLCGNVLASILSALNHYNHIGVPFYLIIPTLISGLFVMYLEKHYKQTPLRFLCLIFTLLACNHLLLLFTNIGNMVEFSYFVVLYLIMTLYHLAYSILFIFLAVNCYKQILEKEKILLYSKIIIIVGIVFCIIPFGTMISEIPLYLLLYLFAKEYILSAPALSKASKLKQLKKKFEYGTITKEEYQKERDKIINSL